MARVLAVSQSWNKSHVLISKLTRKSPLIHAFDFAGTGLHYSSHHITCVTSHHPINALQSVLMNYQAQSTINNGCGTGR